MQRFINLFPLWAVLLSVVAYFMPQPFAALQGGIVPLLAVVMFCMGMTLTWEDFAGVLKRPAVVFLASGLQFACMPFYAWLIASSLCLPVEIMTGLVLVGASAGGTASNVICYLAGGNVALSVLMTTLSTFCAVVLMPALTWMYLRASVDVPVAGMLQSLASVVLLPVLAGCAINSPLRARLKKVRSLFPLLSSLAVVTIIAIIVGLNQNNLSRLALPVLLAVCLHNLAGLVTGYAIARLLNYDERTARTLAIEVGMQNSGLSVALAVKYFSPLAALPGALFSIWHNISGSMLAFYWRRKI